MTGNLHELARRAEVLTFDCYGTLIDWRAGLESSLLTLFGADILPRMFEVFERYVAIEMTVEAEGFRSYRDVMNETVRRLGDYLKTPLDRGAGQEHPTLPDLLGDWPPFDDTVDALRRLAGRYRLGVLSNVDVDLFAHTAKRLQVPFDFVVTAQDVGAYKPAHAHFERLFADHAAKEKVIHVAQSQAHDGRPADELDLAFVWINRYNDQQDSALQPAGVFPTLAAFADAVGV